MADIPDNFKWDWAKFWRGKVGNKFIAWVTTTILVFCMIEYELFHNDRSEFIALIVWGIATVVFMLNDAIDAAVRNAKINADFKVGISKETK